MRRTSVWLTAALLAATATAVAQVGPSTTPATRPVPAGVAVRTPGGDLLPTTGPVAVPYTLSNTNHLVIRLKINGHGPYNFVVDTGAPTMLVDEKVAADIGLRPEVRRRGKTARAAVSTEPAHVAKPSTTHPTTQPLRQGWATIDRLDVEGGLSIADVKCLVLTPYQIEGMNAMGVAGVRLDGLLGYSVLARFKLDIDLTKHEMMWTPQPADFVPPALQAGKGPTSDAAEDRLESMGGVLKFIGPLIKASMPGPAQPRGFVGVVLGSAPVARLVWVDDVLGDSPAAKAGVRPGDQVVAIDGHKVRTAADAERLTAHDLPGDKVDLTVRRDDAEKKLTITCGEGL